MTYENLNNPLFRPRQRRCGLPGQNLSISDAEVIPC